MGPPLPPKFQRRKRTTTTTHNRTDGGGGGGGGGGRWWWGAICGGLLFTTQSSVLLSWSDQKGCVTAAHAAAVPPPLSSSSSVFHKHIMKIWAQTHIMQNKKNKKNAQQQQQPEQPGRGGAMPGAARGTRVTGYGSRRQDYLVVVKPTISPYSGISSSSSSSLSSRTSSSSSSSSLASPAIDTNDPTNHVNYPTPPSKATRPPLPPPPPPLLIRLVYTEDNSSTTPSRKFQQASSSSLSSSGQNITGETALEDSPGAIDEISSSTIRRHRDGATILATTTSTTTPTCTCTAMHIYSVKNKELVRVTHDSVQRLAPAASDHDATSYDDDNNNNNVEEGSGGIGARDRWHGGGPAGIVKPPLAQKHVGWTPIQGLLGVYNVPSGQVWVCLLESTPIYEAPGIFQTTTTTKTNTTPATKTNTTPAGNTTNSLTNSLTTGFMHNNQQTNRRIHHLHPPSPDSSSTEHIINTSSDHSNSRNNNSSNNNNNNNSWNWWTIHRVEHVVFIHVVPADGAGTSTARTKGSTRRRQQQEQRHEEQRQLQLLRKAWKDHDWYYCTGSIVTDCTRRLQDAVAVPTTAHSSEDVVPTEPGLTTGHSSAFSDSTYTSDARSWPKPPDSRFFWNEAIVEPLAGPARGDLTPTTHCNSTNNKMDADAYRVLFDHTIPITSAFCGVQTHLSCRGSNPSSSSSAPFLSDNATWYDEILLTRRSRFRAGTRFTRRGADATGAVANYAETEQIVLYWQYASDTSSSSPERNELEATSTAGVGTTTAERVSTQPSNSAGTTGTSSTSNRNRSMFEGQRYLTGVASHVQTRGSIPLRWSSPTDMKTYRPRVRIGTDPLSQARAMKNHLVDQAHRYVWRPASNVSKHPPRQPGLVLVNLVDKKSDQGRLGRAFHSVLQAVLEVYSQNPDPLLPWLHPSNIQHVWYDFHAQVKAGRWDRLSELLDQVKPTLLEHGYFAAVPSADAETGEVRLAPFRFQAGVVRTNCMDCLDRTNVVQSILGRYTLFEQLSNWKDLRMPLSCKTAFRRDPLSLPIAEPERAHRLLWADNADAISRLYAGTNALKGDFTRTGHRTKKGALDDGMNSLHRFYLNNFLDADRQEGIDLMTGYQSFRNLDDDDESEDVPPDEGTGSPNKRQPLSIQDAVRHTLLGQYSRVSYPDRESDRFHARIKVKPSGLSSRPFGLHAGQSRRRRSLTLGWLPGDLRMQVNSLVKSNSTLSNTPSALEDVDRRASSDLPWWVIDDSLTTVPSSSPRSAPVRAPAWDRMTIAEVESAAMNNGGYLLGAMVAGTQAPLTLAAVVLGLVACSLQPSLTDI